MKGEVLDDMALIMHTDDTVATALADLTAGQEIALPDGASVTLTEDVSFGHKLALRSMAADDDVQKYGEVIGTAATHIHAGDWVHTHNCESARGRGDLIAEEGKA